MKKTQLSKFSKEYAARQDFKLQPDKKILSAILEGLLANEKRYGERYCPCRVVSGDREKDKAIICPCIYHEGEIAKQGHCLCRLFLRS